MPPPRIACLFVPLFPLAARLRSEPELKGEAVAVFEGNGNTARVVAATRSARRRGIQRGQTLPQARALLPDLIAKGRDRESERAAQEALLEIADSLSPRVEDAGEGVVYIDGTGLELRFSGPSREKDLGLALIRAAEKEGLPARAGIAASKLAARVAAGLPNSPTIVPEGEEAQFLAPLPLERLAPQIEIAATLERWGIRSIGELARLPEGEVASRLGELGRELHATARGIDPRPLEPRLPPLCLSEGMELEWPLVALEPFLFLANAALERLAKRLESQGLACTRVEVGLKLDPDGYDARGISFPAPTRDVKTLLTLIRLELEARPPGAPVAGFAFTAHPDKPRRAQLALFGPAALSPDRLATAIARLAALLGRDRVGSPRTVEGYRPERFASVDYAPPSPPTVARLTARGRGLLTIRVLRPPVELEVIAVPCHGFELSWLPLPEGAPQPKAGLAPARLRLLSLKSVNNDGSHPDIQGTVRVAAGPWSLEEGWWLDDSGSGRRAGSLPEGRSLALRKRERSEGSGLRSSPHPGEPRAGAPADPEQARATARDYWDVELSDGALYRIYRERSGGTWFADGIYD